MIQWVNCPRNGPHLSSSEVIRGSETRQYKDLELGF